jgi:hypothetical protein
MRACILSIAIANRTRDAQLPHVKTLEEIRKLAEGG